MTGSLQNGIYYEKDRKIGNSFCIVFLKIGLNSNTSKLTAILTKLWTRFQNLKKGEIRDLNVVSTKRTTGNLSILLGYSSDIFSIDGVKKNRPTDFKEEWNFILPDKEGGGPVTHCSNIHYSKDTIQNPILNNEIVIQFIAEDEFHTHRALLETWRELENLRDQSNQVEQIHIANYYTGFHTVNGRNLIGFHDGISNLKPAERLDTIAIKPKEKDDSWAVNGTYLSFLRIRFNLREWESLTVQKQELLIGRDKVTGCPITGMDRRGKPIVQSGCPVPGTFEVIDKGNEMFRGMYQSKKFYQNKSPSEILQNTHIARNNPLISPLQQAGSTFKIFRQGFQYVDSNELLHKSQIGLNFICFQNTPENLFKLLTYNPNEKKAGHHFAENKIDFQNLFSVACAGNYFVPPISNNDQFPGSNIFIE